ncbi:MAG TPA: NADH-quinone oxidoreductase subunit J [Anaerolineae bacterium]|nr:NADH-quinone oxidoreductase subunit J [Anaerolineae bacterium]HPL27951.1 NADH-quinone oxidoreductase subunit J [Anaerolineae bacterium]
MSLTQIVFIILAGLALLGAVGMVALRNLVHTVLSMVLAFLAVAGVFVLLDAGFLAMVQILIYVGALAILILFAIMLTRDMMDRKAHVNAAQWPLALVVAAALFALLGVLLVGASWPTVTAAISGDQVVALGEALVGPYALPFEAASVLLLAALIGAIVIAREARA